MNALGRQGSQQSDMRVQGRGGWLCWGGIRVTIVCRALEDFRRHNN